MDPRDLASSQLGQVALGLGVGTLARYAMRIQDRLPITWRELIADLFLLGLNALLTLYVIDRLGTTGKGAILTAALFAIGQDRIIRVARRAIEKRAGKILDDAGLGEPDAPSPPVVTMQVLRPDERHPRATPIKSLGQAAPPPSRADFDRLLKDLDDADE